MANSEDIEARLCAYIDGDLDAYQRESIERHLRAHPQHSQMIEDLIRIRSLVADLPHAQAPADLDEGLQGQLERAMLLGNGEEDTHDPWVAQARRVPQLVMSLAVLMLAVGLGSAIYYLLRAASHPPAVAAIMPIPAPSAETSAPVMTPATQPASRPAPAIETVVAPPTAEPAIDAVATSQPTTEPASLAQAIEAADVSAAAYPTTQQALQDGQPATQPAPVIDDIDLSMQDAPSFQDPVADVTDGK